MAHDHLDDNELFNEWARIAHLDQDNTADCFVGQTAGETADELWAEIERRNQADLLEEIELP